MGGLEDEAVSVLGNVCAVGAEACLAREGDASEATEVEDLAAPNFLDEEVSYVAVLVVDFVGAHWYVENIKT